jgi:hypothetical protein
MNIKNLVSHVIDRAVDRITAGVDDDLLDRLSRKLNLATLGEHVEVDYATLGEHVEVDYDDLAGALDHDEIASYIDCGDLAGFIETSDIAESFDASDIAGELDASDIAGELNFDRVAAYIDYKKLSECLQPMQTLSATAVDPTEGLNLDSMAGKLLEAAVDKLLFLANKSVEEGLAHEQKTETEESNGVSANTNLGV